MGIILRFAFPRFGLIIFSPLFLILLSHFSSSNSTFVSTCILGTFGRLLKGGDINSLNLLVRVGLAFLIHPDVISVIFLPVNVSS